MYDSHSITQTADCCPFLVSLSPCLVKESRWQRWRPCKTLSQKKTCWKISWRNTLTDCPRIPPMTQNSLLTPWKTCRMWVFEEDGAPQRPLVLWPSTEVHLDFSGGMLGPGLLQEAETVGKMDPIPRGEDTLILKSWSVFTGSNNDQVEVNIHFCVKVVALVSRRLLFLNQVIHWVTNEGWAKSDQKQS